MVGARQARPGQAMNPIAQHWTLDPDVAFLNHGSFGACPKPVLAYQQRLRNRLERQPVQFFVRDLEPLLDDARASLAAFLGAEAADVAWVPNATTGVNAVLRSLRFEAGDELLVTDHEYNACRNALEFVASRDGARVVTTSVPFPLDDARKVIDAVMSALSERTRLVLLDHISSQTGLIMPLAQLLPVLRERGVLTLIDGAHAPGMIDVELRSLDADFYTGNCHKWICAPKGAGFLYVRRELQQQIRPPVISHGANSRRTDRSRFLIEFDWTGTWDPTAVLSVPEALRQLPRIAGADWAAIRRRNRELALEGRSAICDALAIDPPAPSSMIGSLAAVPLPPATGAASTSPLYGDPLQDELLQRWQIEVPIVPWPAHPSRLLRISAQLYNEPSQYHRLARALGELF